jgi:hypothetical protein
MIMTQTIHFETENTDDNVVVDVYKHPNNALASLDDPLTRYCYTVSATKFTLADLKIMEEQGVDDEHYLPILDALFNSNNLHIWKCTAENGHDDYEEFHSFKHDAINSLYEQSC